MNWIISTGKDLLFFSNLTTEIDVVNYILDKSVELKTTYYKYQELLLSIKEKNYNKTSIKTLYEFKDKIYNTFNNNYHNGFIEGNNYFIKVLKRIAFEFRSFRRFKVGIMICKNLLHEKKTSTF